MRTKPRPPRAPQTVGVRSGKGAPSASLRAHRAHSLRRPRVGQICPSSNPKNPEPAHLEINMGTTLESQNGNQVLRPKLVPICGSKSGTTFWFQIGNQFLSPDLASQTVSREPVSAVPAASFFDLRRSAFLLQSSLPRGARCVVVCELGKQLLRQTSLPREALGACPNAPLRITRICWKCLQKMVLVWCV